jgi:hypothetical protein
MRSQHESECTGNEAGDAIGLHVDGITEAELYLRQELATIRIQRDVEGRAEHRDDDRQHDHDLHLLDRLPKTERADRYEQHDLRGQHPPSSPSEKRQRITIQ